MAPKSLERSCYIYKDIWSSRNELLPENVFLSSNKKYIFDCYVCGHEYIQTPQNKTSGNGCPFCSNNKRCGDLKCISCLNKSCYKYKDIWSEKNYRKPQEVATSTHKKYLFICKICNHDYEQSPSNKTKGKGCPFCVNIKRCGDLKCISCLNNSCYIYGDIWSEKNNKKPEEVATSNNKKYWFICKICNHDYEQSPANKKKGEGCPFCSNNKLCGIVECIFCLNKSCNIYCNIWNSKNYKKPEEIAIKSNKKYWFVCLVCKNDYEQRPLDKTRGNGCPFCVNKSERKVSEYLKEINIEYKKEFKINSKKRYDFFIPEFYLIIEVDGDQHFRQVRNWGNFEHTIDNDIQKMEVALENGYSILRIYQPDIWLDKIDWKKCINDNLYTRENPDITCKSSIPYIYNRHE
jgi:very-short-patch-repair endonuclease